MSDSITLAVERNDNVGFLQWADRELGMLLDQYKLIGDGHGIVSCSSSPIPVAKTEHPSGLSVVYDSIEIVGDISQVKLIGDAADPMYRFKSLHLGNLSLARAGAGRVYTVRIKPAEPFANRASVKFPLVRHAEGRVLDVVVREANAEALLFEDTLVPEPSLAYAGGSEAESEAFEPGVHGAAE